MTSTVEAELPPTTTFPAVLRALFPCGSIAGAPKLFTMQIIRAIESTPRGLYTGSIGWIDAPGPDRPQAACGDFCLSVAIRTLTLGPPENGWRAGQMGVGAGIVIDSVAADEFAECALKVRFLTGLLPSGEAPTTCPAPPASSDSTSADEPRRTAVHAASVPARTRPAAAPPSKP
jgi:para-aminobenzoate synthetase/4-amino-4-deoxychorismate lyase